MRTKNRASRIKSNTAPLIAAGVASLVGMQCAWAAETTTTTTTTTATTTPQTDTAKTDSDTQFLNQSEIGRAVKLPVHEWIPQVHAPANEANARGIVVALQALIFDGKAFDQLARHLNKNGYVVYSPDFRGYGDWLSEGHDFGGDKLIHFGQSKDDLTTILKALREKYPQQKIYCLGESIGANIAIWEASTNPALMDGAIVVGLTNKHRNFMPRPYWAVTLTKGLSHPKKPINIKPYMKPVLTENKKVNMEIIEDSKTLTAISPTDLVKANITNKNSLLEVEKIPPSMPILVIAGAEDRVQKTSTLKVIMDRMGTKQKELVVLPKKGHLLIEHRELDADVSQLIDGWLAKRESSPVAAVPSN